MSIPKSKIASVKNSFTKRKEVDENKGAGTSTQSIFFKALDGKEKKARYEVLLFTPSYLLPKYKETFDKEPLTSLAFPVDHHAFKVGDKYYSVPCKRQTVNFDFVTANKEKGKCPVCSVGFNLKKKYWDKLNAAKADAGGVYDDIPEDIRKDFKSERMLWWKITNKKAVEYVGGIFVKIDKTESGDVYTPVTSIKWWKSPGELMKSVSEMLDEDNYIFAEDYDESGEPTKGKFVPGYYLKMTAEKDANPYYVNNFINNTANGYGLERTSDNTIHVTNEKKSLSFDVTIPDIYAYYENYYDKFDDGAGLKAFIEDFNVKASDTETDEKEEPKKASSTPAPKKVEEPVEDDEDIPDEDELEEPVETPVAKTSKKAKPF